MSEPPLHYNSTSGMHDAPSPIPRVEGDGAARHDIADEPSGEGNGARDVDTSCCSVQVSSVLAAHGFPQNRPRVPRLPQELINLVLDSLWTDDDDLRTCMLVCRAWHLYVVRRGLLAGTLHLKTASALASLVKSLPAVTARLRDIHTAHLTDAPPGTASWLHRAPLQLGSALHGVTALFLDNWCTARAPLHPLTFPAFSQFHAVVWLYLADCAFSNAMQPQRLLVEFPQLRVLGLVGVYFPKRCAGTAHQGKPPPKLQVLWLGNSRKAGPREGEENVAVCLAEWFTGNGARLEALKVLRLEIRRDLLGEGELASLGRLVEVIGLRIRLLRLDFIDLPSDLLDRPTHWRDLKLACCPHVQILSVYRSVPALRELALLSPACRIRVLQLRRWAKPHKQKTDWAALATVLKGDVFANLKKVVNARLLQSGETRELEVFVGRMHARGVEFEDRTQKPFWDYR